LAICGETETLAGFDAEGNLNSENARVEIYRCATCENAWQRRLEHQVSTAMALCGLAMLAATLLAALTWAWVRYHALLGFWG
jgi:hypothetical protein